MAVGISESRTKLSKKTGVSAAATPTSATTVEVNEPNEDSFKLYGSDTSSDGGMLEKHIVDSFKKEFKGMSYTDITVIVRCGAPSSPTYQEIELPAVSELLRKHRK